MFLCLRKHILEITGSDNGVSRLTFIITHKYLKIVALANRRRDDWCLESLEFKITLNSELMSYIQKLTCAFFLTSTDIQHLSFAQSSE